MTSLKIDKSIKVKYPFYGHEYASIKPITNEYQIINSLFDLYEILERLWSAETCAPRMRNEWKKDNPSLGQCSITSFLVQDIFGGDVYGVKLDDGNYHLFNLINNNIYDLTSMQFKERLNYTLDYPQDRNTHFKKEEKYLRYKLLKQKLKEELFNEQ